MNKQEVIDETNFLQLGQREHEEFASIEVGQTYASRFSVWPTKEDPALYQFNSMWLELSME